MGFRSTLISECGGSNLPQWFVDKYSKHYHIDGSMVSTKVELKFYGNEFFEDYQKALIENNTVAGETAVREWVVAVLAEDGFITRVVITKDDIKYYVCSRENDQVDNGEVWWM